MTLPARITVSYAAALVLGALCFLAILFMGPVEIPFTEIFNAVCGREVERDYWRVIVVESRLPMAVAALVCGAALSPAGLILQTTFRNPLAGPSILGVSSGASLGVALVMLLTGAASVTSGAWGYAAVVVGAIAGAGTVIAMLVGVSAVVKNPVMLLIVGILLGYLASSVISLLTFIAPAESLKSYMVWGLGSFAAVSRPQLPWMLISVGVVLLLCLLQVKPLNAMLLGERYAESMGYNVKAVRTRLLVLTGLLTAVVTAFCGPIAFIGIIVPHICRMALGTSNHVQILPFSIVAGAAVTLFCGMLTVTSLSPGTLPINAVTPIIGVPLIMYIIFRRR